MNLVGFDNYEDLVKGVDKSKMVQVRVTVHGKNGDFQRMQWKNPKDVTSSDVVVSKPDDVSMKTAKKPDQPSGSKQRLVQILGGHSRDKVLDFAKQNGVKWVETNHAGINWMRASIAIQKHMDENSDAWKAFESGKDSQQPTVQNDQKNNPVDQGDAKKDKTSPDDKNKQKTAKKKSKPDKPTVDKDKTKQLVDKLGKDNVLETMKAKGITWTETDHKGINWMRAMQALGKHLNDNPSGFDDTLYTDSTFNSEDFVGTGDFEVTENPSDLYMTPNARNNMNKVISGIKTAEDLGKYLESQGIKLIIDYKPLKTNMTKEIKSVKKQSHLVVASIEQYKDLGGLSALKAIHLYDPDLPVQAQYSYRATGESNVKDEGHLYLSDRASGFQILHEFAHAYADSSKPNGKDVVEWSAELNKKAKLSDKASAYFGANSDVIEAEKFADTVGGALAYGNKQKLEFLSRVGNLVKSGK